jgi:hypothetical protein
MRNIFFCVLMVLMLSACSERNKAESIRIEPIRIESFKTENGRYVPAVADGGVLYIVDSQTGRAYFRRVGGFGGGSIEYIDYVTE